MDALKNYSLCDTAYKNHTLSQSVHVFSKRSDFLWFFLPRVPHISGKPCIAPFKALLLCHKTVLNILQQKLLLHESSSLLQILHGTLEKMFLEPFFILLVWLASSLLFIIIITPGFLIFKKRCILLHFLCSNQ